MIVKEKGNPLLQQPQQQSKYSSMFPVEESKVELGKSFDWNLSKDKKRSRHENSYRDFLAFKKHRRRRQRQVERSRSRLALKQREATFIQLVNLWREETRGISSTNQMSMHPAYQQIIGMGEAAIPLLLRELEKKSGRWFWALECITREDPVPPEHRGKTKEMIRAWLDWGRWRGYVW